MTLVTVSHCVTHLRLPNASENSMLTIYLAEALAEIIGYIGRPVTQVERVFRDAAEDVHAYGRVARLSLPEWPIDPASVEIEDRDGATVDAADYSVRGEEGFIEAAEGGSFSNGPYAITAEVGLSASARYAVEYEPLVNGALLALVADKYARRTSPGVSSESAAGGLSRTFSPDDLPPHIRGKLDKLRLVRG